MSGQVPLEKGELLRERSLVIEVCPDGPRTYLWIGCADDQGQHCVATVDLHALRQLLRRAR